MADGTVYGSLPIKTTVRRPWVYRNRVPLVLSCVAAVGVVELVRRHPQLKGNNAAATSLDKVVETGFSSGRLTQPILDHASFREHTTAQDGESVIDVDVAVEFQEIYGFGGAFTEASALQFQRLPKDKQEEVLRLYFDQEHGAAYSFGRVPMNSCDFSPYTYSFADVEHDVELEHFDMDVKHDQEAMIPFIKRAMQLRSDLKLFLSPWSPPAWMKNPDSKGQRNMLGSAQPYGLHQDFQPTWALYFSKFIDAYKRQGINFWGLTPQNEPQQPAPWEACLYDDSYQADFLAKHLGPRIRADHPEMKIMIFDHNRGNVHMWANAVFNHSEVESYIDGVAFHWYDNSRELDGVQNHEHVSETHNKHPQAFLLATESANCPGVANGEEAWNRGLRYAHDILSDINHWASGWVDWNLILDHTGGPNKLGNTCDAPVIVHPDAADFTVQPMYHFIKQFSAFVPPGSKRIASRVGVKYATPGDDARLSPRFPGGAYGCDASSRQRFVRTSDSKLQLQNTKYCLDVVPEPWLGDRIEMVECQYTSNAWTFGSDSTISFKGQCLTHNADHVDGGRLTIEPCSSGSGTQKWSIENEQVVNNDSNHCITAGYAFTQAVAFRTPEDKTVLIVLNENTVDAKFTIRTGNRRVESTVPALSIRTYVWSSL